MSSGRPVNVEPDREARRAPIVSSVLVAYNSAGTLPRALAALADPEGRVEAIVVDNASRDASREVAAAAGARVIESGGNCGFAAASNIGAAAAQGDVLLFANPDTEIPAAAALRAAAFLRARPNVGAVGLPHRDASGALVPKARRSPTLGGLLREALGGGDGALAAAVPWGDVDSPGGEASVACDWVQGSALALRRDVFEAVGGMSPGYFLYFEDIELCDRVRARGLAVRELTDPALAVLHDESGHAKYHSRVKVYAWHRACALYFESRGRSRALVRAVIALRAILRATFWCGARLLGRVDAAALRARLGGYLDTLRFCAGRAPPLPSERAPEVTP